MENAGSTTVGKAARQLQMLNNHRRLVATIFQPSEVVGDDRDELFHCAASQGMLSSFPELLSDERASYDAPDRFGRTPLHWAAEQGHQYVAIALLTARARVDPRSQRRVTPIMLAASKGHEEVVGVLLHFRAGESDFRLLNRHSRYVGQRRSTALHCAAAGGHAGVVIGLLNAGFDRRQHDEAGLIPAEVSARQSHFASPAITHTLFPTSDMGGQLLYDRVDNMLMEEVGIVSGLVKAGAFLDWQDGIGNTPLHQAILFRHDAISRVLLEAGADPNLSDILGASPLHAAAFGGNLEMVADLLVAGADTELLTISGESPLLRAVVNNKMNAVSLLLNAGASTEHRDTFHGQTPLSWACKGCLAHIVRALVEAGADVESRCSAGLTPLHWACRFIDAENVEVLLNAGADPGAVDKVAAKDAVGTSSSRSGTIVSIPVAIDVIGLGYPLDGVEDSSLPFTGGSVTLEVRRLDLVSVRRIESALHVAMQERSWRRRGWLVILASRRVAMNASGVRGKRGAGVRGGSGSLLPVCVSAITNNDISGSRHVEEERAHEHNLVSKIMRIVRSVGMTTRSAFRQQGHARGKIGAREELAGALLELAATEVGVFRRVVKYI